MGFLQKLVGGTFESNREEADGLLAEGLFGEAKMAYERALRKADRVEGAAVQAVRDRIAECRIALAKRRIAEADALIEAGDVEQAGERLADALEICDEPGIAAEVDGRKRAYQASIARMLADSEGEMSAEELLAVIAGTWTEAQADEYAALPDAFRDAVLAAHDGDHATAVELMERAIAEADVALAGRGEEPDHYYAHLELGLEKARAGLDAAAVEHLRRFVEESDGDEEAAEKRVQALVGLSRILGRLERHDEAEEALAEAARTLPKSYETWMALGVHLRGRGKHEKAIEMLDRAIEVMGQLHPNFAVVRELGLTYLAMGNLEEAERNLFAVIEHAASQSAHEEMDPLAAVPLAKIYEGKGEPDKAANLYRHLAVGHDLANHLPYNLEAARLLHAAGAGRELVQRYLARAEELARTDAERAALAKLRDGIGA